MRTATMAAAATIMAVSACGSGTSSPRAVLPFPSVATVTYCTTGNQALTLDVLEPSGLAGPPRPALVVVHGGSWSFGTSALDSQNTLTQLAARALLADGFAVVSINYRLAPRDVWPAQIIDTRCAIRYLRATAPHWDIDPSRIVVLGNSAGAQLGSLDALSAGLEPQWDSGQYASQSSAVAGVVDLWGPIDLAAPGWGAEAVAIGMVVFQASLGADSDALRRASPVTYVHAGAPPFLIVQGLADTLVPPGQATELRDRLAAAGDPVTLIDVAHAGHELRPSGGSISPTFPQLAAMVVSFVRTTVR